VGETGINRIYSKEAVVNDLSVENGVGSGRWEPGASVASTANQNKQLNSRTQENSIETRSLQILSHCRVKNPMKYRTRVKITIARQAVRECLGILARKHVRGWSVRAQALKASHLPRLTSLLKFQSIQLGLLPDLLPFW
jgi:hypothetical protein